MSCTVAPTSPTVLPITIFSMARFKESSVTSAAS
jgi:hypothetical protein